MKKLRCNGCKRFFRDDFCDMDGNFGILADKEHNPKKLCAKCLEKEMNPEKFGGDVEGQFFCPVCNLRTSEKTYLTTCVICKNPLERVGWIK